MVKIAIYLPSLAGGGVSRMAVDLAGGLLERGHDVDLVLARWKEPVLLSIPPAARVIDLKARRSASSVPALARYLRREKPYALIPAPDDLAPLAVSARLLALKRTRVIITEHSNLGSAAVHGLNWQDKVLPGLLRLSYPFAYATVAVSNDAADELSRLAHIPRKRIEVIYNPVPAGDIVSKSEAPLDHAWFSPGQPPVILAAGRLTHEKDFPTLLRAFALVQADRRARLVILGEGPVQPELVRLAEELGIAEDLDMPGFDLNPYRYMARSAAFVLSSLWEGFGNVLVEALACGTQVVSTDCPGGPSEILDGGKYGRLAPVGDPHTLAEGILAALDRPIPGETLRARAGVFSVESAVQKYLEVLGVA